MSSQRFFSPKSFLRFVHGPICQRSGPVSFPNRASKRAGCPVLIHVLRIMETGPPAMGDTKSAGAARRAHADTCDHGD